MKLYFHNTILYNPLYPFSFGSISFSFPVTPPGDVIITTAATTTTATVTLHFTPEQHSLVVNDLTSLD